MKNPSKSKIPARLDRGRKRFETWRRQHKNALSFAGAAVGPGGPGNHRIGCPKYRWWREPAGLLPPTSVIPAAQLLQVLITVITDVRHTWTLLIKKGGRTLIGPHRKSTALEAYRLRPGGGPDPGFSTCLPLTSPWSLKVDGKDALILE
jgi:hypothetical protein